jgi:hypothetical protein
VRIHRCPTDEVFAEIEGNPLPFGDRVEDATRGARDFRADPIARKNDDARRSRQLTPPSPP